MTARCQPLPFEAFNAQIPSLLLGLILVFPISASAQDDACGALAIVTVQFLRPDRPAQHVSHRRFPACNRTLSLPVTLTFRIPAEATPVAVASDAGGAPLWLLLTRTEQGPKAKFKPSSMLIEQNVPYPFENYQPSAFNGDERIHLPFGYTGLVVESFQYLMLEPLDVTTVSLDLKHETVQNSNGLND
ncbi:MAG: hypothetical protein IPG44_11160 [Anaerolineales bacterium]|nr:hypothetical protein [Anaerolineales bacterium]